MHYRISSFKYLISILKLFFNSDDIPKEFSENIQEMVDSITKNMEDIKFEENPVRLEQDGIKDKAKLDRQEELLVKLLEALFYSVSIEEVKEEAQELIKGICEHYVLLHFGRTMADAYKFNRPFSVDNHEGKHYVNENTIFDAISYALSFYIKDVREAGIQAIKNIFGSCVELFGSPENALKFLPIRRMCTKFVHCCFEEAYYDKLGGCIGLRTMVKELGIPYQYFALRQLELSRAMFFVLRDTPPDVPSEVCSVASDLVLSLLKDCNREVSRDAVFQQPFQAVVSQIVFDLSNSSPVVRTTAQQALTVLSESTKVPIATMISPSKGILLAPIFGKPLRALPFPMQIGNIDAITFCLSQENTFLEFNDELNRLLSEALALVDTDDESLISAQRISEHRTSEQLVKLRVVCIELLSLALTKPEFSNANPHIRIRILGVFFKTLCAKSSKIINAAHAGLKRVLSQNSKLPKDLLQSGLRPMLMNLSDHKKLTVSGLEALSRLLELLISYFKVEIGRKLLDHLMAWAQPQALQRIAKQELENNSTIQIVVAILNIFHLLPPQAFTFMEELITTLLFLESSLRRHHNSPFRVPIAKFLNRFPEEAVKFFISKFSIRAFGTRFSFFVSLPECSQLREVTKRQLLSFVQMVLEEQNSDVKCVKLCNLIDLTSAIASQDESWLVSQSDMLGNLLKLTSGCNVYKNSCPLASPIHFQLDQSISELQDVYSKFIISRKLDISDTFKLIEYLCSNKLSGDYGVINLLFENVVKSSDVVLRQKFLQAIIEICADANKSLEYKIFCLQNIFLPICLYENKTTGSLEKLVAFGEPQLNWIVAFDEKIWKPIASVPVTFETHDLDKYRLELLQVTSFLVKNIPSATTEFRKDIIKYNWNLITLDDMITKQAAYVSTAYFISSFETPSKVATQVFVALLKANQLDIRHLVRQALDILAPVLETRIGPVLEWLKWPRRVLSEDGFNVTQVLNVYQFIVHHPDLFYSARDHFIPNIITAMGKLTLLNNGGSENQVLAIDMAELILKWETKAKEEAKQEKSGIDADGDQIYLCVSA
ncbi:unnamed protein product [Ambrosiozyma monospora]|uniref:Unnamed protein product n=1 Tax=Ambrosiozyma monospora TaxID=43982 RepID=A0ACB5SX32_AMBMO|nr:unnamed protein product [Ambrosiozyma monospora]